LKLIQIQFLGAVSREIFCHCGGGCRPLRSLTVPRGRSKKLHGSPAQFRGKLFGLDTLPEELEDLR